MSGHYEQFGKYILLEKLATGGMAEVFLARGTGAGGIGKFFAIKRILPQYADSPEFIDMFKDEAKIAINLNHSNIVSIHEFGVEKGQFFLVMDYVEGRNLRQILNKMKKSSTQFSIDQIVFVMKEVTAGLDHAHRCIDGTTGKPLNITHRDMSPQNIMVSFEGEVKIVDFGIAKAESQIESTRAGTLKGKFGYMSPEQAEGQPVDLRTDIFSMGIVLWELLANDRLFVANNEINTLRKIRDCQIPSLRKVNPNIHAELERIVQKSLARDRNLRYQTGAALHRDLNRFLNRQYPDFSPQDFAVFVKSVFADEILALRKRLLEYAKVNLSIDLNVRAAVDKESTRTELMNTNESSVGMTSPSATPAADKTIPTDSLNNSDLISVSKSIPDANVTDSNITGSDEGLSTDSNFNSNPSLAVSVPSFKINSTLTGEDRMRPAETVVAPPKKTPGKSSRLLDDEVLKNAMAIPDNPATSIQHQKHIQPIEIKAGDVLKAEDLNVPAPPPEPSSSMSAASRPVFTRPSSGRETNESAASKKIASFVVASVLVLIVYGFFAKFAPGVMGEVVQVTDPVLHPIHVMLGIDTQPRSPTATVNPTAPRQPERSQVDPFESNGIVVTSNPSGAEIILNEQSTGMVTPSRVEVTGVFSITIRKKGYAPFNVKDTTRETIGHRLDATLQKLNIAYLDVEIFPPQPANLYINGKLYQVKKAWVREVPIPGGTPIKVRAETLQADSYEEVTVSVPTDKRKIIKVNPRKSARQPSNYR